LKVKGKFFQIQFSWIVIAIIYMDTGVQAQSTPNPWDEHGALKVSENRRYLEHEDGTPFLWMGGTAWSMYIKANREDVKDYLDDRQAKSVTAVQAAAYPFAYPDKEDNYPNRYGHRPFEGTATAPDLGSPRVVEGGSPDNPNDYWDHSDFMVRETKKHGMVFAILPCWGSGFINNHAWGAWHDVQFTTDQARAYGKFLAERYKKEPHIIWVLGGDTEPGDKIHVYRAMAEGIVEGGGGQDNVLMTYHPRPPFSSSEWFNNDTWLDFNMIETHKSQNRVVDVVTSDYNKNPTRPTMLGEGHYESEGAGILGIHRDAFHSYLSGGMGYVYGLGLPVAVWDFDPQKDWRSKLDAPGASDLPYIKQVIASHQWWKWIPDQGIFESGKGEPRTASEKVAVKSSDGDEIIVYYADNSPARIKLNRITSSDTANGIWFNPSDGNIASTGTGYATSSTKNFTPPHAWEDAVLILNSFNSKDE
jgi:hypothetical protein